MSSPTSVESRRQMIHEVIEDILEGYSKEELLQLAYDRLFDDFSKMPTGDLRRAYAKALKRKERQLDE